MRRTILGAAAALALIAAAAGAVVALSGTSVAVATKPTEQVEVVNTPDRPVPTAAQGTTEVAGSVGIDGGANRVVIANPASDPVPVAPTQPPLEPVQLDQRVVQFPGHGETFKEETVFTVPEGRLLIVQFVSAAGAAPCGTQVLRAEVSVGEARVFLPLSSANDCLPFAAAEDVTLYGEPGQTVVASYRNNEPFSPGQLARSADFTIVGHLVDLPAS